jgi:hypothetical protein
MTTGNEVNTVLFSFNAFGHAQTTPIKKNITKRINRQIFVDLQSNQQTIHFLNLKVNAPKVQTHTQLQDEQIHHSVRSGRHGYCCR